MSERPTSLASQSGVTVEGNALRVGGKEVPLLSAAVHYWRMDPEAWAPAIASIKQLGFPIVETYIPWRVHEPRAGVRDFGANDPEKNIGAFLDLVEEAGLLAFVRPGPHINAEMTCFGLPDHVVSEPAHQARSPQGNPVILSFPPLMFPVPSYASTAFEESVADWYESVGEIVGPRMYPKGPVVLLQVDNEAAFYFRNGPYCQDYHPDAIELWRSFLRDKYWSLEEVSAAFDRDYERWEHVDAPRRFDATSSSGLALHLEWAAFQEWLLARSISRMRKSMEKSGMMGVPFIHNIALGDSGLPVSLPRFEQDNDIVGFDYYHPAREHETIKRRTLYLAGSARVPYAPELGVGAPPWFTPLDDKDSLYCAMTALAYGLRGFNLYMAVDRDRWYGAPIDGRGNLRVDAGPWRKLVCKLREHGFHRFRRDVRAALVMPREYMRLSRATHLLGAISPSTLEAIGASPVAACREDTLGFEFPIQLEWWEFLENAAAELESLGVPYVTIDSECDEEKLDGYELIISPSYEFVDVARWSALSRRAREGATVVFGPQLPSLSAAMRPQPFEVPKGGHRVITDDPERLRGELRAIASTMGLGAPFRAMDDECQVSFHERGGARLGLLFVMRPHDTAAEVVLEGPNRGALRDLLTGEEFVVGQEFTLPMESRTVRALLYRATPQKRRVSARADR